MAFIADSDYNVQIRAEISKIIDETTEKTKLKRAVDMAVAQMKNYLGGRYDVDAIFIDAPGTGEEDLRDQFIVMSVIDMALYHLWSKEGGNNIPKTRELRYADILDWLKAVQKGAATNLPLIVDDDGEMKSQVKISSQYERTDNRY